MTGKTLIIHSLMFRKSHSTLRNLISAQVPDRSGTPWYLHSFQTEDTQSSSESRSYCGSARTCESVLRAGGVPCWLETFMKCGEEQTAGWTGLRACYRSSILTYSLFSRCERFVQGRWQQVQPERPLSRIPDQNREEVSRLFSPRCQTSEYNKCDNA